MITVIKTVKITNYIFNGIKNNLRLNAVPVQQEKTQMGIYSDCARGIIVLDNAAFDGFYNENYYYDSTARKFYPKSYSISLDASSNPTLLVDPSKFYTGFFSGVSSMVTKYIFLKDYDTQGLVDLTEWNNYASSVLTNIAGLSSASQVTKQKNTPIDLLKVFPKNAFISYDQITAKVIPDSLKQYENQNTIFFILNIDDVESVKNNGLGAGSSWIDERGGYCFAIPLEFQSILGSDTIYNKVYYQGEMSSSLLMSKAKKLFEYKIPGLDLLKLKDASNNNLYSLSNFPKLLNCADFVKGLDLSDKKAYKMRLKHPVICPVNTFCVYDATENLWFLIPIEYMYSEKLPFTILSPTDDPINYTRIDNVNYTWIDATIGGVSRKIVWTISRPPGNISYTDYNNPNTFALGTVSSQFTTYVLKLTGNWSYIPNLYVNRASIVNLYQLNGKNYDKIVSIDNKGGINVSVFDGSLVEAS